MDKKRYPSTRFVVLTENDNIASAKKTYFIWIITVTILFCISVAFFSYKIIVPVFLRDENSKSFSSSDNFATAEGLNNFPFKFYNPEKFLDMFKKQTSNGELEFTCKESQAQLKAIPLVYAKQFQKRFYSVYTYINLDLLLYYEHIINKYEAKNLKLIFNEYESKLSSMKKPEDFVTFLLDLKSTKCHFYANYLKQKNYDLKLINFVNFFDITAELNHWYNYLDLLRRFLSSYEQQKLEKYFINCTENNFEKFTAKTQMQLFHFVYPFNVTEKKLQEINLLINELAEPVRSKVFNASILFYRKIVILSEIKKKISALNVPTLKNVFIFASNTIYLDEDMELPDVNLAIIAPNWSFLNKIKINLNGSAREEHIKETASSNQPGKPGNPGKNAGNFLGVGNFQEKFLFVFANGGKGGKGQNGAKGSDGVNNTLPDPPIDSPACMTKLNIFNNSFGQTITHYKVYNREGCGGSGTDGGVGGVGGAGGVITFITKNSVKILKGLNGSPGSPGKGGAGGVGGRNGCFYEVFDVDEEILHRVTTVKCSPGNILPSGGSGRDNYNTQGQILPDSKENLTASSSLIWFLKFARNDLINHDDASSIRFLKEFNNFYIKEEADFKNTVTEYKLIKELDKIELYEIFLEKILKYIDRSNNEILPFLKCLKFIALGRILTLKSNFNFYFTDVKIFLNVLKRSTRNSTNLSIAPVSYLNKKIETKCEHIKVNLKNIKIKLNGSNSEIDKNVKKLFISNDAEPLNVKVEKKFLCVMITAIDVTNDIINWFLKYPNLNSTQMQATESSLPLTKDNCFKNNNKIFSEFFLSNVNISDKKKTIKYLQELKDFLHILKDSNTFSKENKLLEELIDELEHFIALYCFIEWKDLENLFSESLNDFLLSKSKDIKEEEEVEFMKTEFKNVFISILRKLAVNAVQQNLPSFIDLSPRLQLSEKETEDVFAQINFLQEVSRQETFCKNQLKAVFDKHSAVGEFYFWPNAEVKDELQKLFSGAEVNIKSNLINRHVFDKNFIQFLTLKLEFECSVSPSSCEDNFRDILLDFKIEITHSGYSYYNWEGEAQIVVSEKVSLDYSFKMLDNEKPEIYNSLFKKCQDGEVKLSPFTTYTIRLVPLNNRADYAKLSPFVNTVNLRLTGTGTYFSE